MLKDIQRSWKKMLTEGDEEGLTPYLAQDSLTTQERLSVYQHAYWVRLVNTLIRDFPLLQLEMGAKVFKEMAVSYLQTHEPTGFSLHHIGKQLPHYLGLQLTPHHPLVELAHLERVVGLIRLAENQPSLCLSTLQQHLSSGDSLLLKVHPSLHFFSGHYNTLARWQAFSARRVRPKVEELSAAEHHVLWRGPDLTVETWAVSEETQHDLSALVTGQSLQAWCDGSDEHLSLDEAINQLVNKVLLWAEKGLLVDTTR